jgi:sugar phosphate isomerase/epimerase
MAELGFTRVEMWKQHPHRCKTPELRQSFSRLAASRGISMGGLNVVGDDYYRPFGTEQEFQRTLQGLKADVDYALTLDLATFLYGGCTAARSDQPAMFRQTAPPSHWSLPRSDRLFRF